MLSILKVFKKLIIGINTSTKCSNFAVLRHLLKLYHLTCLKKKKNQSIKLGAILQQILEHLAQQ